MKVNSKGLALIKHYEGFRARAYKDPVGIWTIGYGHTSMAGQPIVKPGMVISRQRALEILSKDVEKFSSQIRPFIKVKLNNNQFSALVSFAYNVGVGGFKRSSVLRVVNAGRFEAVPARLALWVKAGGKTYRGLVKRRAAEGGLFLSHQPFPDKRSYPKIKPVDGKPLFKSTTGFAAIISAIAGLFSAVSSGVGEQFAPLFTGFLFALILVATAWIIKERWLKSKHEGV